MKFVSIASAAALLLSSVVAYPTVLTEDFEEHTFDNLIDHFNF